MVKILECTVGTTRLLMCLYYQSLCYVINVSLYISHYVTFYYFEKILILLAAARMTQRDMAMTVIGTNGQRLQCGMPIKITIEADCPPCCPLPSSTYKESTTVWKHDRKRKSESKHEKKCEDIERRQMSLPTWKSEYQDSISKLGHAVIRAKLHRAKRKALPIHYQYYTTSN